MIIPLSVRLLTLNSEFCATTDLIHMVAGLYRINDEIGSNKWFVFVYLPTQTIWTFSDVLTGEDLFSVLRSGNDCGCGYMLTVSRKQHVHKSLPFQNHKLCCPVHPPCPVPSFCGTITMSGYLCFCSSWKNRENSKFSWGAGHIYITMSFF